MKIKLLSKLIEFCVFMLSYKDIKNLFYDFIFESAKCQLTNKVKAHLELKNIKAIYVSPRLKNLFAASR